MLINVSLFMETGELDKFRMFLGNPDDHAAPCFLAIKQAYVGMPRISLGHGKCKMRLDVFLALLFVGFFFVYDK